MRCILCDRCKTIVENPRKIKVVTYAKPLSTKTPVKADDSAMCDHIWTKELCPSCSEELENFMNQTANSGADDGGSNAEDSGSGDPETDEVMSE